MFAGFSRIFKIDLLKCQTQWYHCESKDNLYPSLSKYGAGRDTIYIVNLLPQNLALKYTYKEDILTIWGKRESKEHIHSILVLELRWMFNYTYDE